MFQVLELTSLIYSALIGDKVRALSTRVIVCRRTMSFPPAYTNKQLCSVRVFLAGVPMDPIGLPIWILGLPDCIKHSDIIGDCA